MRRRHAAALAAALFATLEARASGPPAALEEVPVYVTDGRGNPVADLTREDFELKDDGKPVALQGFEAVNVGGADAAGPEAIPPAARRRFLLLFDTTFSQPRRLAAARAAAKEFVTGGLRATDLVAVATLDASRGVRFSLSFTADRAAALAAIDAAGVWTPAESSDPLALSRSSDASSAATREPAPRGVPSKGQVASQVQGLFALADSLASIRGRKNVLFFSEGFEDEESPRLPAPAETEAATRDADDVFGRVPGAKESAPAVPAGAGRLSVAMELFSETDSVVYPFDLGGLEDAASSLQSARRQSLSQMASETGGLVFQSSNDLSSQLQALAVRTSFAYVLSFAPRSGKPAAYHALRVNVRRPGLHVSARRGYFEARPYAGMSAVEKRLATSQMIMLGLPRADLGSAVVAAPFRSRMGGSFVVPVIVELPGARLSTPASGAARAEVYAYLFDVEGRVTDFFTLSLSAPKAAGGAPGFKVYGLLAAPPGAYSLRVLVRDETSGRTDLKHVLLEAGRGSSPALLGPFFREPPDARAALVHPPRKSSGPAPEDDPFLSAGGPDVPSAIRRTDAGGTRLLLVAYDLPPGVASLVARRVEDGSEVRLEEQREERAADGSRRFTLTVPRGVEGSVVLELRAGTARLSAPPLDLRGGS